MMKMNFDNKLEDEDKHLIRLLKEELEEFPTDQLVERTMARISAMQEEKKFVYKPLKTPLFMMAAIAFLLIVPVLIPIASNSVTLKPLTEFFAYPENSILKYAVCCWLTVVGLWIFMLLSQARRNLA